MRISDWSSDVCSSDLEAIHRLAGGQILYDIGDGAVLIVGFLIGKARDKAVVAARIGLIAWRPPQRPLGRRLQKLARDLADAFLHPRLAGLPLPPAPTDPKSAV